MLLPLGHRPTTATLRLPSDPAAYTNTPVHRLPTELLIEIFRYCACKQEEHCDPDFSSWQYDLVGTEWLDLLLVCRHWHDVACATPALWRFIRANSKREWFDLCIERSAGMTVDVALWWSVEAQSLAEAVETIVAHASQIRQLAVIAHEEDGFDDLKQLWHTRMPVLKEFMCYILAEHGAADGAVKMRLDPALFPALRTFRLTGASFSLRCPVVLQLHTLRLCWADPFPFWTPEQVLQALQHVARHGALRHLELGRAYFPSERLQCTYPIPLLHLESLVLVGYDTDSISRLLPHLWLGPHTDVRVTVDTNLEEGDADHAAALSLLHLIPEETEGLPLLRTTSSVSIALKDVKTARDHAEAAELEIICKPRGPDGHRRGRLAIEVLVETYPMQGGLEWGYTLDDALRDFCTRFAASPLTKLSLREFGTRRASAAALARVFRTFPTLAVVEVVYNHPQSSCKELLEALSSTSAREATSQDDLDGATSASELSPQAEPGGVVLPRLRVLRLMRLPWREDVLPSLVACLQHRAFGGTRLGDLLIEAYDRPRGFEEERSHEDLLSTLRTLSTRVIYLDGKDPRRG